MREVIWEDKSQLSVRLVYLILEEKTNEELMEVMNEAREKLNEEGIVVNYGEKKVQASILKIP